MVRDSEKLKRYTLLTCCFATYLTPFLTSSVNIAIPSIGTVFHASASELTWVVNSFLLISAAFTLPFGRLADIIGRKKLFVPSFLIFSAASFLCLLSKSIQWLIAFRIVQGVSAALSFSISMAILTSAYPPEERGKALGINSAVTYLGLSSGPVIGGFLTQHWGWASIFIVSGVLGLVIFILALTQLKGEWSGAPGESFDWQGAIFYVIGIPAFLYGFSSLYNNSYNILLTLGGLILLLLFTRHETRIDHPLLPLRLLRENRVFAYSNLAALINYAATFAVTFLLSLYLQSVLNIDPKTAGMILLPQPVLMAVVSPFAGRLSDRMDPKTISVWGMTICALGLVFFAMVNSGTPIYLIIANLTFIGIGFGLFASPNNSAIMGSVEKKYYGMASSTLGSMRLSGQSISMGLATLILDKYVGAVELSTAPTDQLLAGIKIAFIIFAVICLGGTIAARQK